MNLTLDEIAAQVRNCTQCELHRSRTNAVPGNGNPQAEIMFIGEAPGWHEDKQGLPFVGAAGQFLNEMLASIGLTRDEVFVTNIVKCRPPGNRDPEPDEVAACAPYLRRQLEVLDPAVVVTLGRHSMSRFMPGVRISAAHGTTRPADPATGARDTTVFAMYHPAAALRTPSIERESYADVARIPSVLIDARERRRADRRAAREAALAAMAPVGATAPIGPGPVPGEPEADTDQLTIF
jgi:DNA polymerase